MKNLLLNMREGMAYFMYNVSQEFFDSHEEKYFDLDEKIDRVVNGTIPLEDIEDVLLFWFKTLERERPPSHYDLSFVFQSILYDIKHRKNT